MGAIGSAVGGLFGIGNGDTNTYSANTGGQDYGSLLNTAQGNVNANQANENQLAGQLQAQANGTGPNIAQQQLVTGTEQNTQQGAGLIAGQKGISSALAGRQIAQNTNNANQQMAGQGAQLRAQQQVGAQGQLAGLYGQQGQQNQANINGYESALTGNNTINAGVASQNTGFNQQLAGGIVGGAGAALMAYKGGLATQQGMQHFANGGQAQTPVDVAQASMRKAFHFANGGSVDDDDSGPSPFAKAFMGSFGNGTNTSGGYAAGQGMGQAIGAGIGKLFAPSAPTLNAPQLGQSAQFQPAQGLGMFSPMAPSSPGLGVSTSLMKPYQTGGKVPGKPIVQGNSPKNDDVPAVLSPGEVVIPNSVMQSNDPSGNAAKFVKAMMARKGLK